MRGVLRSVVTLFCGVFLAHEVHAASGTICTYPTIDGKLVQVNSIDEVPGEYRAIARCFDVHARTKAGWGLNNDLAAPGEVELKGTLRSEDMATPLGRVRMRWQRKIEELFGTTPHRAVADAARTVSRVLKGGGFPLNLQTLDLDWEVVFMDEHLPEKQIPTYLVSACHPAWMTPEANIYVVAQRVVAGCGGGAGMRSSAADAELAHVLMHEMGHAVEYQLLKSPEAGLDRARAEGFASWFEGYASNFSAIVPHNSVRDRYLAAARESFRRGGSSGSMMTLEDYARASMIFTAIEERRGVRGVMDVYQVLGTEGGSVSDAIRKALGWDERRLQEEIRHILQ